LGFRRPYTKSAINNGDRARFVLEHAGLAKRWRESGLTRQQFIGKHRIEINQAIRSSRRHLWLPASCNI
jgi:hypothetical protein